MPIRNYDLKKIIILHPNPSKYGLMELVSTLNINSFIVFQKLIVIVIIIDIIIDLIGIWNNLFITNNVHLGIDFYLAMGLTSNGGLEAQKILYHNIEDVNIIEIVLKKLIEPNFINEKENTFIDNLIDKWVVLNNQENITLLNQLYTNILQKKPINIELKSFPFRMTNIFHSLSITIAPIIKYSNIDTSNSNILFTTGELTPCSNIDDIVNTQNDGE